MFSFLKASTPLTEEQEKYQNTLKGELEEIIGTVVCQSPMDLLDHNKVKLSLTKKN